jgi:hypothetical protein
MEGSGLTETERQIVRKLISHGLFLDESLSSESSLCFIEKSSGEKRIGFYLPRETAFSPPTGELSADWLNIVEQILLRDFEIELLQLDPWA